MSKEESKLSVIKVTLSTGKVVLLHELKIAHTEKAAKMVANEAGENHNLFQMLMQKAIVQQVLYKIDDKVVSMADRDDLDGLFKISEYGQLMKVIGKISGGEDAQKEAKVELMAALG
jgi:hypothetical protein